jgi:hypothetical protein
VEPGGRCHRARHVEHEQDLGIASDSQVVVAGQRRLGGGQRQQRDEGDYECQAGARPTRLRERQLQRSPDRLGPVSSGHSGGDRDDPDDADGRRTRCEQCQ